MLVIYEKKKKDFGATQTTNSHHRWCALVMPTLVGCVRGGDSAPFISRHGAHHVEGEWRNQSRVADWHFSMPDFINLAFLKTIWH